MEGKIGRILLRRVENLPRTLYPYIEGNTSKRTTHYSIEEWLSHGAKYNTKSENILSRQGIIGFNLCT